MLNITQICEVYKAIKSGDKYCRQGLCVGYENIKKIIINFYLKRTYQNDMLLVRLNFKRPLNNVVL